jgi:hypothetical protein
MRPKRNGKPKGTVAKNRQGPAFVALEWRQRLCIDTQYSPDIGLLLKRPRTAFPNIKVRTFSASAYPKQRIRGWANAETRTINIADDVETGLRYADPKSRWDAVHELAHVALHHSGNNLLMGKAYPIEDRKFEDQVDDFIFEFLSPFHLAKHLKSVEEYERRFRIPHDKAIIREHQVDELIQRAATSSIENPEPKPEATHVRKNINRTPNQKPRKATTSLAPEQLFLPFSRAIEPTELLQASALEADGQVSEILDDRALMVAHVSSPALQAELFESRAHVGTESEDQELICALLRDVNGKISKYRKCIKLSVGILTIALMGGLPLLTETVDGKTKLAALATSGIIGSSLAFLQVFDRPIGLDSQIEVIAWRLLKRLVERRGVTRKLAKFQIAYRYGRFEIAK